MSSAASASASAAPESKLQQERVSSQAQAHLSEDRGKYEDRLDLLGSHRRESKAGRAGVGQCLYTMYGGNIVGLHAWQKYCSTAKANIHPRECVEFWLTAKEDGNYGLERIERWIREDRASELLKQMSMKRRTDPEQRQAVGQVLYNAFVKEPSTGKALWLTFCRAGHLTNDEMKEAEEYWSTLEVDKKMAPRLLREWAEADTE